MARTAVEHAVRAGEVFSPSGADIPKESVLHSTHGAFVTLHTRTGDLRGCVGVVTSEIPLCETICEMAHAAATRDHRFSPVGPSELSDLVIEVSILERPSPVVSAEDIVVGRDGLMIVGHGRRGVLLPQVAVEYGWDVNTFVEHTCKKAGLPADAYQEGGVRLYRFSATVLKEHQAETSS